MRTTLISSRDENKGKKKIEEGYVRVAGACDNHPAVLAFSYTLSFMYYQHFFLLILHVQMSPPPFFLQGIFFLGGQDGCTLLSSGVIVAAMFLGF